MKNIPFCIFLVTLFFAPLAFGTVEPWSLAIVELLIGTTAICYYFTTRKTPANVLKVPGLLPLTLFIVWMLVQLFPLPVAVTRIISPGTYGVYKPVIDVGTDISWIPFTVMQKATSLEALRIGSYGVFYFLTVHLLSSASRLTKTVRSIVLLAIGIALLAIIQKFTSPDKIYWFRPTPQNVNVTGPYVYHNHYAGFMEMLCPLTLALFFYYRPSVRYVDTLRAKVTAFFSSRSSNQHFFLGFGVIIILVSVFLSLSRGGMVCICLALLLFVLFLARKNINSGGLLVVLLCCILLALSWFDWQPLVNRLNSTFTETGEIYNSRFIVWRDAGRIIHDFFFTGSGFGTFVDIYPQYRTFPGVKVFDHAHNDYIELLTDGGLVGFCLAAWFLFTVFANGWKNMLRRKDRYAILICAGAFSGIIAMLLHGITDFNMHNGANGLYFFFLCGLLVAAGNTRLRYRTRPTLLLPAGRKTFCLFPLAGGFLLAGVLLLYGGALLADKSISKVSSIYLNEHLSPVKLHQVRGAIVQAASYDFLEARYPAMLGKIDYYLHSLRSAEQQYIHAIRLNPCNGEFLTYLGVLLSSKDPVQSRLLMHTGYERALQKEKMIVPLAGWLFRSEQRQEAILLMKKGLSRYPELQKSLFPLILAYSLTQQEITTVLPSSSRSWICFGNLMRKMGYSQEAEYYMDHALDYLDREEKITPWYFNQLYNYYRQQKQDAKAMAIVRQGIKRLPNYPLYHIYLGKYYQKEGINYRAREEYEQALLLDPGNRKVRRKLEQLDKN